jgi:O-acetyl-ADP-ribose deacetylase (regulator of RNase III)
MKKNGLNFTRGDLFKSKAQVLVNPVNCVGVMGAGIAKEFKRRFPKMFVAYKKACDEGKLHPGTLMLWKDRESLDRYVLNFPTKKHWRSKSKLVWIEEGMQFFTKHHKEWNIRSIAFPALGCGKGGLDWKDIKPIFKKYLSDVDINVFVFEPI